MSPGKTRVRTVAAVVAAAVLVFLATSALPGCGEPDPAPEPQPRPKPSPVTALDRFVARLDAEGRAEPAERPEVAAVRVAGLNTALLRSVAPACAALGEKAREIAGRLARARPDHLAPSDVDELRLLAFAYIQQSNALGRIAFDHESYADMVEIDARTRTQGVTARLAAGLLQQDLSRAIVGAFEDVKLARDLLDRPLVKDKVPPRLFTKIRDAARSLGARAALREEIDRFQAAEFQWRIVADATPAGDLRWLAGRIYTSPSYDELRKDEDLGRIVARAPERIAGGMGEAAYVMGSKVAYPVQVFISTIIGDAVTSARGPRIAPELALRTRREVARPGDLVLERCDFYLSNAFLPGWWGHSALYVGDRAEIERLGLADDPVVKPHLEELAHEHDLIEAVSDGVLLSSLVHVMRADHVAILRPRYPDDEARRRAIRRAFANLGKPYDFNFDFESDEVLVCSELCWRSLEGIADFSLTRRFGRFTLTPDDIAHRVVGPAPLLDLVLFIQDGNASDRARFEAVLR